MDVGGGGKELECLSLEDWIDKKWWVYSLESCAAVRSRTLGVLLAMWMDL